MAMEMEITKLLDSFRSIDLSDCLMDAVSIFNFLSKIGLEVYC